MVDIKLSAKSDSNWKNNQLTAFIIQVDSVNAATFFKLIPVTLTSELRSRGLWPKAIDCFSIYERKERSI